MDLGMSGRSYAVLGGSRGMGWETAQLLAQEGAHVAIISRTPDSRADEMAQLAQRHRVNFIGIAADAAQPGQVEKALDTAIAKLGPLRGMAITNHWMGSARDFAAIGADEWQDYFQNSLMAAVRASQFILPHLAAQGGGTLVLTTAYSSRAPKAYIPAYAAFKAALNNLTKSLAKAYGTAGVRVNAVAPGAIQTGRYEARMANLQAATPHISQAEAEAQMLQAMDMKVALNRIGTPREVADMILFLLSERAGYATGLIANVDGGTDF